MAEGKSQNPNMHDRILEAARGDLLVDNLRVFKAAGEWWVEARMTGQQWLVEEDEDFESGFNFGEVAGEVEEDESESAE